MNIIYLVLSCYYLLYILMQVSSRKQELSNRAGSINSQTLNGYDYLWVLNTSCASCTIKISCLTLSLNNYHSVIFTSLTSPILQDATYKNYSVCPDDFFSQTDNKGFYFVYYYYHYTKFQDVFNFSYVVFDNKGQFDKYDEDIAYRADCVARNVPIDCPDSVNSRNISGKQLASKSNCLFCSRYMHAALVINNTIYVHGGISSEDITDRIFIRYQNRKWERVPVISKVQPLCFYGHSVAYDSNNNELVLFGGIICGSSSFKAANDFIWIYNPGTYTWVQYQNIISRPVIGHSIFIYENIMYSFFGLTNYSEGKISFISNVTKFDLSTQVWLKEIRLQLDESFFGLIYHSAYLNGSEIWIHGGLYINNSYEIFVSNFIYIFNLITEKWKRIEYGGPKLYLHSSVIINDSFLVIGGFSLTKDINGRTETKFSKYIYKYDFVKSSWMMYDTEFTSVGAKSFLNNNDRIIIVGGKTSAFKYHVTRINLANLHLRNYELNFSENNNYQNLQPAIPRYCNELKCESCVRKECVWCDLTKSCISRFHFNLLYHIGVCESPISYEYQCPVKCEDLSNSGCQNCTKLQFCGWCEFNDKLSGFGKCTEGTIYGPNKNKNRHCKNNRNETNWSFLPSRCSACNCNGHAECIQESHYSNNNSQEKIWKCSSCLHNTSGDQCQYCLSEHQGSPINGHKCSPCKCVLDNSAAHCNPNGLCDEFCTEKGRIGKHCNECDIYNFAKFHGMCVIKSKINFKYILNETDNYNTYINRVRFLLSDFIPSVDLGFKIQCINSSKTIIKVELYNKSGIKRTLIPEKSCLFFEKIFSKSTFEGKLSNKLLFTISGFKNISQTKPHIEIIFIQKSYTSLPYIFISLFACLFTALLLFYTFFKMRQHIRHRSRNYHTLLVMERPFVKIHLKTNCDIEENHNSTEQNKMLASVNCDDHCQLTNSRHSPLVCVEPYSVKDNKTHGSVDEFKRNSMPAVVSFLFQSPKCNFSTISEQSQDSHLKHSSRIMIGSTIVRLTKKERKHLLELPTKSSSGNNLMVERDFDTSISPSAAEELLITEV